MEKRIIELYRRKFDDIRHEEDGIYRGWKE